MRILILLTALLLTGCASTQNLIETAAITKPRLGFAAMATHQATSQTRIDHTAFDGFLRRYVRNVGGVNLILYGDVTDADKAALDAYVSALQSVKVTMLNPDEQLAFWFNLYNAETIRVILENYPVASIRKIKSSPFDFKGPWNDKRLTVEGETLTLDDIENKIVRPVFDDPRIHYAFNCAAMGCPNLKASAYRGAGLDTVLDAQARAFINHPRGVSVRDGKITASKIFLWYQEDFGENEREVLEHIRKYASPELTRALAGKTGIDSYEYDWALNGG